MTVRRSSASDNRGISLVEVMIASLLTLVVLGMGYDIFTSTTKAATAVGNRAQNSTQARLAIDTLEADLRFANGVWLCAPLTSTPQSTTSVTASCPAYTSGVAALLVSNQGSPTCSAWLLVPPNTPGALSPNGVLYEMKLGALASGSIPLSIVTSIPGVQVASYNGTSTTGFALNLPFTSTGPPSVTIPDRLVSIDLSVNQDTTVSYSSSDSVTVHDFVAPNNLATQQYTSAACT